ncbi:methyltransferase [Glonium stellatum]|uniref:Methyltransferase n=1 Tax=Glonium stellatum TaxID=574774 RepID=A0A8E2JRA3_9PEZI|nr:methyltransferase [Glonium stellatum]
MAIVESQMSYLEPWSTSGEPPFVRGITDEEYKPTNFNNLEYSVQIADARPQKDEFQLDTHGFAFHGDDTLPEDVLRAIRSKDNNFVADEYYPIVERLITQKTGATRVVIFDHTYRKKDPALNLKENPNGREQPATVVHVDQSSIGAIRRVHRYTGDEAEKLLQGRVQLINVWRPINGAVEDWPLAVMDYRSLKQSEIHPTNIFKQRYELQGQTVSINHSNNHKWYYLDSQGTNEVTLIKIWDNKGKVAQLCPHCAFPHPQATADSLPRESIEVRCLVFYGADSESRNSGKNALLRPELV